MTGRLGPDGAKPLWACSFEPARARIAVARHSLSDGISMKILCAWCCREGQPGYLGEREPLENPAPTHGICMHHKAQLLESLPAPSFPDVYMLIVVRRDNTALYERLKWSFAAMSRVKVIMDRRVFDRRVEPWEASGERRHMKTRRIRESTIFPLSDFTVLRFTPKAPPIPAPLELDHRSLARGAFDHV